MIAAVVININLYGVNMYNIYSYDYDLLKVVSTIEEAKRLTEFPNRLPGEHGFNREDDPYEFEKREDRLRHAIDVIRECNPDVPAGHPELAKIVDWVDEELILGDSSSIYLEYNSESIYLVVHQEKEGRWVDEDRYDFINGELV